MSHAAILVVLWAVLLGSTGCHVAGRRAEAVALGTPMDATLKALRRYEIPARPEEGAYGAPHGREAHRYVVESCVNPDGLFLMWEEDAAGREYRLEEIYLQHDWQNERHRAKGERREESTELDHVYLSDLKTWVETGKWAAK